MRDVSMKVKRKTNMNNFLSLSLALGVCLMSFSVAAQEIVVVDNASEPMPVDFPVRSSLSEVKEAPLPSLADSIIKEPAPMEKVVSKKELPSEQLLGRITSEVFHEMADLERGNVFLKLQAQREELKNNLEALKAKYRQARLDEIEKRENVIRLRVKWQQDQERIRQDILEKQLKTELLEKELEAAEMAKEDLMPVEEEKVEVPQEVPVEVVSEAPKEEVVEPVVEEVVETPEAELEEEVVEEVKEPEFIIQKIVNIKGMKGKLVAKVIDDAGKQHTLKVGSTLPTGDVVKEMTHTDITLEKDGVLRIYNIEELASFVAPQKDDTQEKKQDKKKDADKKEKAKKKDKAEK